MTKEQWLELNPGLMLHQLEALTSTTPRKRRLLAAAYASYLQTRPEFADCEHIAHLGEDVAEGRAALDEVREACARGRAFGWNIGNLVLADDDRLGNAIRSRMALIWPVAPADQETAGR